MPKILIVRLSSMGDVIHNLPAVTDLAAHYPNAELHWVVEEGFAELPALHPAVVRTIPFALRRWRKKLLAPVHRDEMRAFRDRLRAERYDLVIDSQGLLKSALVAKLTGAPIAGYDRRSIREPLASWCYDQKLAVSRSLHAIARNRLLTARAMGYQPGEAIDYGVQPPAVDLAWRPRGDYAVLLTATSRDDKLWPEADWVGLGQSLARRGIVPVLPWGGEAERLRAERIAAQLSGAVVAPRLLLGEAARLLADARLAVGVDTGLVHLAAAVGVPTIALFCASEPGLTGVLASGYAVNLGGYGRPPALAEVEAAVAGALA
ncbi:lipopolysaccharide heptosyltransferase I [Chitinimonas koreensis]|uniref:lipopolysaccharide heptosyltransferase I n=1 Tax=Chitinimonas koreensis TaxID=356302 RepID=UPI000413F4B0|nr:lipopolysaccharide heptosyltransferase I [Chitinimonas koreensis]QNM96908.1 lipopolysaccharide heptosyltransferase I [Chitinimonas koreensis]